MPVVRLRNLGTEAVAFEYPKRYPTERPPTATDGDGEPVRVRGVTRIGFHIPVELTRAPGEGIEISEWTPALDPAKERDDEKTNYSPRYGPGTFRIQYENVLGNSSSGFIKVDPAPSKLGLADEADPPKVK